jgi:hypothetical protein
MERSRRSNHNFRPVRQDHVLEQHYINGAAFTRPGNRGQRLELGEFRQSQLASGWRSRTCGRFRRRRPDTLWLDPVRRRNGGILSRNRSGGAEDHGQDNPCSEELNARLRHG